MFELWPFTNYHDMNLDWIISKIKNIETAEKNSKDSADAAKASEEAAADSELAARESEENALTYKNLAKSYSDNLQPVISQVHSNTEQINQIISGSTADADAELVNIRISSDIEGITYTTAGEAVRTQIEDVYEYRLPSLDAQNKPYTLIYNNWRRGALQNDSNNVVFINTSNKHRATAGPIYAESDTLIYSLDENFPFDVRTCNANNVLITTAGWPGAMYRVPAGQYFYVTVRREPEDSNEIINLAEFGTKIAISSDNLKQFDFINENSAAIENTKEFREITTNPNYVEYHPSGYYNNQGQFVSFTDNPMDAYKVNLDPVSYERNLMITGWTGYGTFIFRFKSGNKMSSATIPSGVTNPLSKYIVTVPAGVSEVMFTFRKNPTDPAPQIYMELPVDVPETVTLMEYNIGHYCYGTGNNFDETGIPDEDVATMIPRMKEFFADNHTDILMLCEYWQYLDNSRNYDAKTALFDWQYPYNYTSTEWNALFSRYRLRNRLSGKLSANSLTKYYKADIQIGNKTLGLLVVHFTTGTGSDKEATRQAEMTAALALMDGYDYAVIAGDFNSYETERDALYNIAESDGWYAVNGGPYYGWKNTYYYTNPTGAIDNILVKGRIKVNKFKALYDEALTMCSDHIPLVAELTLF